MRKSHIGTVFFKRVGGCAHLGYENTNWEGLFDSNGLLFLHGCFLGIWCNDIPLALIIAGEARLTLGTAGESSLLYS